MWTRDSIIIMITTRSESSYAYSHMYFPNVNVLTCKLFVVHTKKFCDFSED